MTGLLDRVAGAPITWGACEVPGWGVQLDPGRVLREMADLGLRATELGPPGFLPTEPGALRDLLAGHGLELVGGFLPVVLHRKELDPPAASIGEYADLLAGAGAGVLVLAASSAHEGYEDAPDLDSDEWARLVRSIRAVEEIAGARGLTVALHPHVGTVVERAEHVRRLLETSDVALCVDTGHLLVGGADPLEVVGWAEGRVAHVHLKDADAGWAERLREGRVGYRDAVAGGMYRPLGEGDLDVRAIVGSLEASGYGGWYVLEQDTVVTGVPDEGAGPVRDAAASLELLRRVAAEPDHGSPAGVAGGVRAHATRRPDEGG